MQMKQPHINKIQCKDFSEYMSQIQDKSIDILFTSPPPIIGNEMINIRFMMIS